MASRCRELHSASNVFKGQIQDYTQSGNYYVTPEVAREVRHLDNGVNHIRLDYDLVNTDKDWAERWRGKGAMQEQAGRHYTADQKLRHHQTF